MDNHLNKFTGNPRDAIDATGLTKGDHNTSRNRGGAPERLAPMTMSVLCQLWELIKTHIVANHNVTD